ncbi:MAG: fatty acid--CoA ligase family protein [Lachnospiraceae bacterium]|nr:fatty acid--CoA ligase family protein [Lachnospiraceae bacterium]
MPHIEIEIRHPGTDKKCQQGEIGEIVVKSENLMTAYYRVRIEDQSLGGDGWLHTGDLGYIRSDGYLCFTGRLKELIIRGGENIYPNEVASVISMLSGIDDVKIVRVQSDFYGEEVCACIRLKEGASFDEARAREELKKVLAKFKIPSFFILYDRFPVLATGKVDMIALKKDAEDRVKAGI